MLIFVPVLKIQVDPTRSRKKNVEVYELMVELIKAEEKCRERVRESEEEVLLNIMYTYFPKQQRYVKNGSFKFSTIQMIATIQSFNQ